MQSLRMVEALLFASQEPLTAADLARVDAALDEDQVEHELRELSREYRRDGHAFDVVEIAGGYQLLTRPEFAPLLERFDSAPAPSRLSGPALETLAIVAYRQPMGRAEIEEIRGVGAGGVLKTLQERELVEVIGRGEGLGRPLLYGTTRRFLEHFGFRSLADLPRPEDLPVILSQQPTADADGQ